MNARAASWMLLWGVACTPSTVSTPQLSTPSEPTSSESFVSVMYAGEVELEAHLANPGDTVPVQLQWAQTCDERGTCLVEQTTGKGDDASTVRIWSVGDAVWVEGAESRSPAHEAVAHRRLLELFGHQEDVEIRYVHPRLGVTFDRADFGTPGPSGQPKTVRIEHYGAELAWRGNLELGSVESLPSALQPSDAPPKAESAEPSIQALGDGLWDVKIPEHDARSFVVELDTFVVVIEAPWSREDGQRVVDLVTDTLPDKPIRYVAYSHHHPHYTGGLPAFIAAGATLVVPEPHADFVRSVARFDFETDAPPPSADGLALETFVGRFAIQDGERKIEIFDIGEQSRHTAAYMVFWLPETRTLIEGDLGWFVDGQGGLMTGERSAGLLQAIDDRGLDVQTLLQTWPVVSQEPSLSMEAFRTAVKKG